MDLYGAELPPNRQKLETELVAMEERLMAYEPRVPWQLPGPDESERLIAAGPSRIEQVAYQLADIDDGPLAAVVADPHAGNKKIRAVVTRLETLLHTIKDEHSLAKTLWDQQPLNRGLFLLTYGWKELEEYIGDWLMHTLDSPSPPELKPLRVDKEALPSVISLIEHLQTRGQPRT